MDINEEELKKKLTPEQYKVLREKGTEAPFSGKYVNDKREGVYHCAVCGNALFASDTKFDSGTGWPSFDEALPDAISYVEDNSHGMQRIEVVCAKCGSHLGHVFDYGPSADTRKHFCLNSVCLNLDQDMEK